MMLKSDEYIWTYEHIGPAGFPGAIGATGATGATGAGSRGANDVDTRETDCEGPVGE